jgi:hypothetical protein
MYPPFQGPFSVAPCQTLTGRFAPFASRPGRVGLGVSGRRTSSSGGRFGKPSAYRSRSDAACAACAGSKSTPSRAHSCCSRCRCTSDRCVGGAGLGGSNPIDRTYHPHAPICAAQWNQTTRRLQRGCWVALVYEHDGRDTGHGGLLRDSLGWLPTPRAYQIEQHACARVEHTHAHRRCARLRVLLLFLRRFSHTPPLRGVQAPHLARSMFWAPGESSSSDPATRGGCGVVRDQPAG